jgi:hypothetical protein
MLSEEGKCQYKYIFEATFLCREGASNLPKATEQETGLENDKKQALSSAAPMY